MAGSSVTLVAVDKVVVEIGPWLGLITKPEGHTVTVPVPLLYPELAIAVIVDDPDKPAPSGCPWT